MHLLRLHGKSAILALTICYYYFMRYPKSNLHTAGKKADWEDISNENRNIWQHIAASSKGVLTPANVISVLGAALVGLGLWYIYTDNVGWGFIYIAIGRLADILDGAVAQATGTKSSVGEAIDAGLDKAIIIAALIVFFITGTIPLLAAILIALRNIINMTLGLLGKAHKKAMHPSRAGKLAASAEWTAILLFIIAGIFDAQNWTAAQATTFIAGYVALGLALLLGLVAMKDYGAAAVGPNRELN